MLRPSYTVFRSTLALLIVALATACASSPPKPEVDFNSEYNFSAVTKVAFYKNSGMVSGDNPAQISDMQRNRVDRALQMTLENKGISFVEDPKEADLLLSWHLSAQDKTDVRTYQTAGHGGGYYGGYNRYSRYNCWSCGSQTEVSVKNYTEGTFIVDMIDPAVQQSVWRSVTQSRLKGERKEEQETYDKAAAVILADFPPY
ncbi:MAG: DUF4136 domain-containing protein [Halioglobus sp.]